MSLAAIWSGNFHQLRNSLGGNSRIKLFKLQTGLVYHARKLCVQPIATGLRGQVQNSQNNKSCHVNLKLHDGTVVSSTKCSTKQSELQDLKAIQCHNLHASSCINKPNDRPAAFLVFDIETTGFIGRREERIIELAVRDLSGGKNSTFETLINPEKDILNAHIHGIHTHMVNKADVPTFKELAPILLEWVRSRQMPGKPVVLIAHNGRRFDVPFLVKELQRCSMEIPAEWLFIDSLPLARQLVKPDGSKLTSSKLETLREYYGIPLVGSAHRAMQDVTTLCYVLQRITFDLRLTVPVLMDKAFRASDIIKTSS